jgi:hypothetical protein
MIKKILIITSFIILWLSFCMLIGILLGSITLNINTPTPAPTSIYVQKDTPKPTVTSTGKLKVTAPTSTAPTVTTVPKEKRDKDMYECAALDKVNGYGEASSNDEQWVQCISDQMALIQSKVSQGTATNYQINELAHARSQGY